MQGTYLGIYINPVCAFWNYEPPLNCRFCTTGKNVVTSEALEKSIADVVETCRAAKEESGITFVHLNGGFQGSRGIAFALPYVRAIKEEVGLLVGLQLTPETDFTLYDTLISEGLNHISFCLEFLDPEWFGGYSVQERRASMGSRCFLEALKYCALAPNRVGAAAASQSGRHARRGRIARPPQCRVLLVPSVISSSRRCWRVPSLPAGCARGSIHSGYRTLLGRPLRSETAARPVDLAWRQRLRVLDDEVSERLDEQGMTVERGRTVIAGDAGCPRGVRKQHVDLVQRFNVIRHERERDDEHVGDPFLAQFG